MCGIAGIYGQHEHGHLWPMMLKIRHRGPDDLGQFHGIDISLGHTRLSIIDLSGGRQPIQNEDGRITLVFNGEIYNYRSLRENLLGSHRFSTNSDTEVIVHLYEEMGERCVEVLDGMFAFAIYDSRKKEGDRLFLARDRIGIKPLYLEYSGKTCFFASELKALPLKSPATVIPPGHTFTREKGLRKYFELPQSPDKTNPLGSDVDSICRLIRTNLEAAVTKRLMSDVPVGVFLSGGLDSSLIAALMKRHLPELHTFAVGMERAPDLGYAREVAGFLGTIHHEYIYSESELRDSFQQVIYYLESFDLPLVRSAFPCYFVSRLARQHNVKVILTGEGADELFSGYHYLKEFQDHSDLYYELKEITERLHGSNLQRVDRMSMAWGVECRVPFLDMDFIRLAFSISPELKKAGEGRQEKWILRQAFQGYLPESVLYRRKEKFSEGAGSLELTCRLAEDALKNNREKLRKRMNLRSDEEKYYYNIFREYYPDNASECIGLTKSY